MINKLFEPKYKVLKRNKKNEITKVKLLEMNTVKRKNISNIFKKHTNMNLIGFGE